jgi:hypothetical protein
MVVRRRAARGDLLRELRDSGVSCPICSSTRFYSMASEIPKRQTPSSDRRAAVRGKPDKPHEFIHANCGGCGYNLFFDPSTFGSPPV